MVSPLRVPLRLRCEPADYCRLAMRCYAGCRRHAACDVIAGDPAANKPPIFDGNTAGWRFQTFTFPICIYK